MITKGKLTSCLLRAGSHVTHRSLECYEVRSTISCNGSPTRTNKLLHAASEQVFDECHLVRLVLYYPRYSGGDVQLRKL